MKFELFSEMCSKSDVIHTELTHMKLKGEIEWLNFSDMKWTLKLHNLNIESTNQSNHKDFIHKSIEKVKIVLFYDDHDSVLSNCFDFQKFYEPSINYDGLEGSCITGQENYFILSRDQVENNEIRALGLGFYRSFITRRKRNKIDVTNLWLYLEDSKNLYKIDTAVTEFCYSTT